MGDIFILSSDKIIPIFKLSACVLDRRGGCELHVPSLRLIYMNICTHVYILVYIQVYNKCTQIKFAGCWRLLQKGPKQFICVHGGWDEKQQI